MARPATEGGGSLAQLASLTPVHVRRSHAAPPLCACVMASRSSRSSLSVPLRTDAKGGKRGCVAPLDQPGPRAPASH